MTPLNRAWNTWSSDRPAEMVYLPLGLRLTPVAYAASQNSVTWFPPGNDVRLGRRDIDARYLELQLQHCGTALQWRYRKSTDGFSLQGEWQTDTFGEWGLRFWLILCFSTDNGGLWYYDPDSGELSTQVGHRHIVVRSEAKPLLATFHESSTALTEELHEKGYFYLGSRATQGTFAALRFNLEEMPENRFVVTQADAATLAQHQATYWLQTHHAAETVQEQPEALCEALSAIRDVVAWNTVWDPINQRAYTALSRNWNSRKFGGFGVWLDDVFYHALLASLFDPQLARENLQAVLAGATPQGNLPCLLTGNDAWVDRSQPPIGSFIVYLLYLRSADRSLLELAYPILERNHHWWWRERDGNQDGLIEYGTSAVGAGLYLGTKLAAKDESSMDNSPTHDEAELNPDTGTLNSADVGLNSLLALDGEMLGFIARVLGKSEQAGQFQQRSLQLKAQISEQLWDEERGVFANRLWSGQFVRSLAPTSFYPLIAGAASIDQAQSMIQHYLLNPQKFGGDWWLPSVTRDDPAFHDNVYWRGRIWPPLNFLTYYGLRRYGYDELATQLADNGGRLFANAWQQRHCPENYNAESGEALDQPDTDSFYSWGALLPYLSVSETIDYDPWLGFSLHNHAEDLKVGPLLTAAGLALVEIQDNILTLSLDEQPVLRTNIPGRLRDVQLSVGKIMLTLPPFSQIESWLEFPQITADQIVLAQLQGQAVSCHEMETGIRITVGSDLQEPAELLLISIT